MLGKFAEKHSSVTHADPILKGSKEMFFLDDFLFPQLSCNCVQVCENSILSVFQEIPYTILFSFIHDNLGTPNFFRSQFKRLVEVIRTDITLNKWLEVLQDTILHELRLELLWSLYIKTDHTYTNVSCKCIRRILRVLFHNGLEHAFQVVNGVIIGVLIKTVTELVP